MSILVDRDIIKAWEAGEIVIEPFDPRALGTNSYDVHLGPELLTYRPELNRNYSPMPLDCAVAHHTDRHLIPEDGLVLQPGELYLGSTTEYTESHKHLPFLEGKSSLGRLGMSIHITAGKGDVGFCNHWTMEITVVKPLRVYAGMPCGQLIWHEVTSAPLIPYNKKPGAKYNRRSAVPKPSSMWENFPLSSSEKMPPRQKP
jgi:dCTP deaminase